MMIFLISEFPLPRNHRHLVEHGTGVRHFGGQVDQEVLVQILLGLILVWTVG